MPAPNEGVHRSASEGRIASGAASANTKYGSAWYRRQGHSVSAHGDMLIYGQARVLALRDLVLLVRLPAHRVLLARSRRGTRPARPSPARRGRASARRRSPRGGRARLRAARRTVHGNARACRLYDLSAISARPRRAWVTSNSLNVESSARSEAAPRSLGATGRSARV